MEKTKKASSKTRILAEITVFASLSAVLYVIRPFSMPYGGAVTLGSMVPVMFLSLRRGVKVGLIAGILFGLLALPIDVVLLPYSPIVSPLQAFLEYPLAFGVLGLAGIVYKKTVFSAMVGVGLGVFVKFLVHYSVGVFVWYYVYEFPAFGRYLYPAVYNAIFLVPEFIISTILIAILVKAGWVEYAL